MHGLQSVVSPVLRVASARVPALLAALCALAPAAAPAGPFGDLAGLSAGWITGDAVGATLTKTLSADGSIAAPGGDGPAPGGRRIEAWLHVGCRASAPPRPASFWLGIDAPPGTPDAPHWFADPVGFALTLWRSGEAERLPAAIGIGGWRGRATVTRALVGLWTEPQPPTLDVEAATPEAAGRALLDAAARGDAETVIEIRGPRVRFALIARWNPEERRFAATMLRHCPPS